MINASSRAPSFSDRSRLNPRKLSHILTILAILGFPALTGCAHPPPALSTIRDDPGLRVTLISAGSLPSPAPAAPYDHPADLSAAAIEKLLGSITVEKQSGLVDLLLPDKIRPAWQGEELRSLAEGLAQALGKAGPNQCAAFYQSRPRNESLRDLTSGAVFVKDDRLILVLANYHYAMDARVTDDRAREDPLYAFPGRTYGIVPREGQKMLDKSGVLPNGILPKRLEVLSLDLRSSSPATEGPAGLLAPSEIPHSSPESVESRLETLQRLLQRGLITEEDFQKKKREILEGL